MSEPISFQYVVAIDETNTPIGWRPLFGSVAASDAFDPGQNPTAVYLTTQSLGFGFNGTTWDRLRTTPLNADAHSDATLGVLAMGAFPFGYNGASFDRLRTIALSADAASAATPGILGGAHFGFAYNGTSFDRVRTNAAAVIAGTTQPAAQLTALPGEWSVNHTPVANTQATASKAAGAAGVRHVCRSISAMLNALTAAAETTVLLNLRDGATGAGTILWSLRLHAIPAGTTGIAISNLNIFGSAATAMTLEFAAAGGANTFESVSMSGYSTV